MPLISAPPRREAYRRLALPFASLAFALLPPSRCVRVRSGKGAGFALGLGIVLAYWLVFTVGLEQARDGRVPVAVGVWSANILVLIWVIVSYALMRSPSRTPWWVVLMGRGTAALGALVSALPRSRGSTNRDRGVELAAPRCRFRFSSVLDRYIGTLYLHVLSLALASTYIFFSGRAERIDRRGCGAQAAGDSRDRDTSSISSRERSFSASFAAMIAAVLVTAPVATASSGVQSVGDERATDMPSHFSSPSCSAPSST